MITRLSLLGVSLFVLTTGCMTSFDTISDIDAHEEENWTAPLPIWDLVSQTDDDTDPASTTQLLDACPFDPIKTKPGICGCGVSDEDLDGNGTPDCVHASTAPALMV